MKECGTKNEGVWDERMECGKKNEGVWDEE